MSLLTQTEEEVLKNLDKLVDWYTEHKQDVKSIAVTKRQYNALMRISKKAKGSEGMLMRRSGELNLKDNIYRGFEISTIEERRRRRNKDTNDMFNL